jgi:hypothetical protein
MMKRPESARLVLIVLLSATCAPPTGAPDPTRGGAEAHAQALHVTTLTVGNNVNISRLAGNHQEGAIGIDPTNNQRLFAFSNTETAGTFAAFSTDGGVTWNSSQGPNDMTPNNFLIGDGQDTLPAANGDPTVSFDALGNLFVGYLSLSPTREVVLIISTDGGANFQQLATFPATGADQPTVVAGPGSAGAMASVWLTYRGNGGVQVHGAAINGVGAANVGAFTAAVAVATAGNFGDIAIGPAGQVAVTYQNPAGGQGASTLFVHTDPDGLGPMPFGAAVTATTTNVGGFDAIPPQPERTVDAEAGLAYDLSNGPRAGRLYLVYTDEATDESNDTNVFVRFFDPTSTAWSNAVQVNDDMTTNSQFLPKIAVDPSNGNVGVSWHDSRNDLGMGGAGDTDNLVNTNAQLFATVSTDGGATFLPNVQVSAGTSQESGSEPPGAGFADLDYGDYTGLAFRNGALFPIWADNSNSTGDNPAGALSTMDIYTARVTVDVNEAPVAICRDVARFANAMCLAPVAPAEVDNGSFDPDGDPLTFSLAPPGPFGLGSTPVTLTVTDTVGHASTCTATVSVSDNAPPVFTFVPGPVTLSSCVHASIGLAQATDNCGPVTITNDRPAQLPLGTTVVTWRAVDAAGNVTLATQLVTAVLGDDPSCCPVGTNIILGTSATNLIIGTAGRDCILGRGGDDVIDARNGDDFVSGGAGRDTIFAGLGNDLVYGGPGSDVINAAPGTNFIDGGPDADTCFVGATDTAISCNP